MKHLFIYAFAGAVTLLALWLPEEDYGPLPVAIKSFFLDCRIAGRCVKISWKIPEAANYEYIRVTYRHPGTNKEHIRLASVYADHIIIDGFAQALRSHRI